MNKNDLGFFLQKSSELTLPYASLEFSTWDDEFSGTDLGDALESFQAAYQSLKEALSDTLDEKAMEWDLEGLFNLAPSLQKRDLSKRPVPEEKD